MSNFDAALDALASWQRRTLCVYLLNRAEDLFTLDELLTHLMTESRVVPDDVDAGPTRRHEVARRLHHVHLPKLASVDVIEYDRDAKLVRVGPTLSTIEPILKTLDGDGVVLSEPRP